jgi:hypothetical protein
MNDLLDYPPMSVDAKLFGPDDMEKPVPEVQELCLVYDGESYIEAKVVSVDTDKKEYEAYLLNEGTFMDGMHFCRYRPVS